MKCFFKGLLGASLLLLIFFFTVPLYANYQARAETAGWLLLVEEVKNVITENAVKNKSLLHAGRDIDTQAMLKTWGGKVDLLQITDFSTVILRGGREGQMLVLIPSLQQGQVTWQCVGGSQHAMPSPCR